MTASNAYGTEDFKMNDMMNAIMGSTTLIILLVTAVSLFIAFRVFGGVFKGMRETRQLMATGISAEAKILQIGETGMFVNNNPAVDIVMEVYPKGQAAYRVQTRAVVSMLRLAQIQPGNIVPVKYSAEDPNKVALAL
jgi:succinate dehydrogenase/fumarate reductase flavoprotein subunit